MAGLIRLLLVLAWVGADGVHLRRTPSLMTGRVLQEANEKTGGVATTAADEIAKDADTHADDVAEDVDAHANELTRKRGMDEKKEKKVVKDEAVVKAEEKEEKEEVEEKEEKALEKEEKEEKKEKKDKKEKKEKKKGKKDDSDSDSDAGQGDQNLEYNDPEVKEVVEIIKALNEGKGGKAKREEIFEEVRMHQLAKLFDHKVRLYIILEALCGTSMDAGALEKAGKVVVYLIENGRMTAEDILWTFDAYLSQNGDAAKGFPMVLKVIYDEEWVKEKDILEYYNDDKGEGAPGFAEAKKVSAPFLKWLETADSSDDDDDDDSDSDS